MPHKVIFDTNSIRSEKSVNDFLGGREDLAKFATVAEIIIPDMVFEEVKSQKRKYLVEKRSSFLSNPFHDLRGLSTQETSEFDIEKLLEAIIASEPVSYSIVTLTDSDALSEIKRRALANLPPFEEGSDKGFKDAYIYLTVIEYLDTVQDDKVFLVTKDDRLRSSFEGEKRVKVIQSFSEFEKYIDNYFREPYFIDRLKEELSVEDVVIENVWLNGRDNWIIQVKAGDVVYYVEADFSSREIIGHTNYGFKDIIAELAATGGFQFSHTRTELLKDYVQYFSDQQIIDLIEAAVKNDQIYLIASDEDIKEFFTQVYALKPALISEDTKKQFETYFFN